MEFVLLIESEVFSTKDFHSIISTFPSNRYLLLFVFSSIIVTSFIVTSWLLSTVNVARYLTR